MYGLDQWNARWEYMHIGSVSRNLQEMGRFLLIMPPAFAETQKDGQVVAGTESWDFIFTVIGSLWRLFTDGMQ